MGPAAKVGKQQQKKGLLDDEKEEQEDGLKISVNESYAKRFEVSCCVLGCCVHAGEMQVGCVEPFLPCCLQHNKKREELHRLQAKHPELAARLERQLARSNAQEADDEGEDEESSTDEEEASPDSVLRINYARRSSCKPG
jgi:hypothetical protein